MTEPGVHGGGASGALNSSQRLPTRLSLNQLETRAAFVAVQLGILDDRKPFRSTVLKREKKSGVVRLSTESASFVLKRTSRSKALIEQAVYRVILPGVPVPSLAFHGFMDDGDSGAAWIAMEDIVGRAYDQDSSSDRLALGGVLGAIAQHTGGCDLRDLPRRGPEHYGSALETTLLRLARTGRQDRGALVARRFLGAVGDNWETLQKRSLEFPWVLCHADVASRNMRFVEDSERSGPVLFDWELASVGPAALDLGCAWRSMSADDPLLDGYLMATSGMRSTRSDVVEYATVGRMLRLVDFLWWASEEFEDADRGFGYLESYVGHLEKALEVWAGGPR